MEKMRVLKILMQGLCDKYLCTEAFDGVLKTLYTLSKRICLYLLPTRRNPEGSLPNKIPSSAKTSSA
jgi:hypothetical protein